MGRRTMLIAVLLLTALALPGPASGARTDAVKIIVNDSNEVDGLTRAEISRYFLKKVSMWSDGTPLEPVDLTEEDRTRELFSSSILRKRVGAVKAYWQQMIFSGRAVPPPEKRSERDVIAFVDARPGAIGYISADTTVGEGVKVVRVID